MIAMSNKIKLDAQLTIQNDIDNLCAERDSIMQNIVTTSNKSEKKSLKWALNINRSKLTQRQIDIGLLK